MKKIMIGTILATIMIGAVALTSGTYATLTAEDSVTNNLSTGSVKISVNENGFTDKTDWNGSKVDKLVQITNESKSPAIIRVSIIPRWVDESGNPWPGDTSVVEITFANIASNSSDTGSNQEGRWLKDSKGEYYYYTAIVPTNKNTVPIIESVSATIPDNLKSRYKGKKLIVDVKSETVLAAKNPNGSGAIYEKAWTNIQDENIKTMLSELSNR